MLRTHSVASVAVTAGLLLALTGCGQDSTSAGSKAESTPTASASESPAAPAPAPKTSTTTPTPKGENTPAPSGGIDSWVKTMTSHGITWDKKNERRMIVDEETRNWQGETPGNLDELTFTAFAITTPAGKPTSLSCAAAGIPDGGGRVVAVLSDCVTAAETPGLDTAAVDRWVRKTLPPMLAAGDFQVEYKEFGELALTMDAAGDTASVELSDAA